MKLKDNSTLSTWIVIVVLVVVIILLVGGLIYVIKGKNAKQNGSATKKLAEIRKRQSISDAPRQALFSNPTYATLTGRKAGDYLLKLGTTINCLLRIFLATQPTNHLPTSQLSNHFPSTIQPPYHSITQLPYRPTTHPLNSPTTHRCILRSRIQDTKHFATTISSIRTRTWVV
jgi:hypothetical protein